MYAITGATGQVGREVVKLVEQAKIPHRPLSRATGLDYSKPETFAPSLEGITRLFFVSPGLDEATLDDFLTAARNAGVERLVAMSGFAINLNREYSMSRVEKCAERSGIPYVCLRANWFYQNFANHFRSMIVDDHLLTFPDGGQAISFIDARDIAEVALKLLTKTNTPAETAYTLTGPEALTHADVAAHFARHLPYTVSYQEITPEEARTQLGFSDVWQMLFQDIREGRVATLYSDVETVTSHPARSLEDYIAEHLSTWL